MNRRQLKSLLVKATKCSIQHDGWPCNTCFHALKLDLPRDIHSYWEAVLAYRGDYPDLEHHDDWLEELRTALTKGE